MMKFSAAFVAMAILAWPLAASAADPAPPSTDPALSPQANAEYLAANAKKKGVIVKPDGLQIRMLQNGFGRRPAVTDSVEVYYTGALINGKVFDGTSPGLPANFKVNQVIAGWTEALQLMREGDHWQIVIPSQLGYGARGAGKSIPPDQTLVFDMTLVSTTPAPRRGEPGYVPDPNDPDDKPQR
ncbi:MAG: FKBP-type peptidyl-prolyl cis-trans isomerase [Alphaproteobacteria bacterium]|nr:FKBP-type peptidyl-prolyl cis-trans isomerase [Alphaproteobacteria bacterium]